MDVAAIRAEIPALARTLYLNTGGTGPSPRRVTDAIVDAYRFLEENGPDAAPVRDRVLGQAEAARRSLAELLGVEPTEIAFMRAISEEISAVAWALPWQAGDEVILTDQEHPSGRLVWYALRDRSGIVVREVALTADADVLLARIGEAITPRTRLLAVSHVTAENGLRLPAREICALAHARGVRVLFDGAQSVGQFPIDLREIGADFYAMTGHKWLLAGYGVGALYVRRELAGEVAVSWTGAGATEHFDRLTGDLRWWKGARRFEFGGRNWPLYVGLGAAVEYVRAVGPVAIEARTGALAASLKRELAAIPGVTVLTPDESARSTGIVCFRIAGRDADSVVAALWERWRVVCRAAFVHTAIRISVAFFTTEEELATLCEAVRSLVREGNAVMGVRS